MPVIMRVRGYQLLFWSNEGDPREPLHVHVRSAEARAKFWIEPSIGLAHSFGFRPSDLREIETVIRQNEDLIRRRWHEHFGS